MGTPAPQPIVYNAPKFRRFLVATISPLALLAALLASCAAGAPVGRHGGWNAYCSRIVHDPDCDKPWVSLR